MECKKELFDEMLDEENIKRFYDAYREKRHTFIRRDKKH